MLKAKSVCLISLVSLFSVTPAFAQSTGVGRRGIYGKSSIEDENAKSSDKDKSKSTSSDKDKKPLTEEEKKLRDKYPLSTTSKTGSNQKAHNLTLQGILLYNQTKAMFDAANEISNTYNESDFELQISQKGIVQARIQPADLLLYGPEYAHIALRVRALQDADRHISKSIASFSQALSLAPTIAVLPKWIRIARDTQKVIRYHIRFYQLSLKAVKIGYTEKELQRMAKYWNTPKFVEPTAILTSTISTYAFEQMRQRSLKDGQTAPEKPALDGFVDQLPKMTFEVSGE